MLLRARIVVPVTAPPVEDGAVLVSGNRIVGVGPWREMKRQQESGEPVVDLGEVVLLPGLVNAHCHLDYTRMAGLLSPPRDFPDWIKGMLALKAEWSYADFAASWIAGAQHLLESGTTTVANIETVPEMLDEVRAATPLRVFSFLELTGVMARRAPDEVVEEAEQTLKDLAPARGGVGLSPHAPYSTRPELLELAARCARRHSWRLTTHVAESRAEFEMFRHRRGTMFSWLKNQRPMDDCGAGTPVQHLNRHGMLGPDVIAVHANCLGEDDTRLLGERGASVVHCPRSHAYFKHPRFPLDQLFAAGVNVCLGTDSLASVRGEGRRPPRLSMFEELRELADRESSLEPDELLRLATVNGARALGLAGKLGEIRAAANADLIAIPYAGPLAQAAGAVVENRKLVSASMIDGEWAIAPAA